MRKTKRCPYCNKIYNDYMDICPSCGRVYVKNISYNESSLYKRNDEEFINHSHYEENHNNENMIYSQNDEKIEHSHINFETQKNFFKEEDCVENDLIKKQDKAISKIIFFIMLIPFLSFILISLAMSFLAKSMTYFDSNTISTESKDELIFEINDNYDENIYASDILIEESFNIEDIPNESLEVEELYNSSNVNNIFENYFVENINSFGYQLPLCIEKNGDFYELETFKSLYNISNLNLSNINSLKEVVVPANEVYEFSIDDFGIELKVFNPYDYECNIEDTILIGISVMFINEDSFEVYDNLYVQIGCTEKINSNFTVEDFYNIFGTPNEDIFEDDIRYLVYKTNNFNFVFGILNDYCFGFVMSIN